MVIGYYYLHANKDLIYKKIEPKADSDFVKKVWPIDNEDRGCAWTILLEASALGATKFRIKELSEKWSCDIKDCVRMLKHMHPTNLMRDGLPIWAKNVLSMEEDDLWAKFKELWNTDN